MNFFTRLFWLFGLAYCLPAGKKWSQMTRTDIKAYISEENYEDFLGIGGRFQKIVGIQLELGSAFKYGILKATVSKNIDGKPIIESDHWPPLNVYKEAKDLNIQNLKSEKMATVSLKGETHRKFFTTSTKPMKSDLLGDFKDMTPVDLGEEGAAQINALRVRAMVNSFKAGDYEKAIIDSVNGYKIYLTAREFATIKAGLIEGLEIHVSNGLISDTQKNKIINIFSLDKNQKMLTAEQLEIRERIRDIGKSCPTK